MTVAAHERDADDARADQHDAGGDVRRGQFVQEHDAEHRDEQRRGAAHQRIGERQVAGPVRVRERDVVREMDGRRRGDERPRGAVRARRRTAAARSAQTDDPATTDAVSSIGSPPGALFSSAFQLACSRPAPRTASVMPSDSSCAGITVRSGCLRPGSGSRWRPGRHRPCRSGGVPLRGFEDRHVVGERRRRGVGHLGEIVPQPHADGVGRIRLAR